MTIYRPIYSAEQYREMAEGNERSAIESFERCDTDGFLSQWASTEMARVYLSLAELIEQGGKATFSVPADLNGQRLRARPIHTRFGTRWALLSEQPPHKIIGWLPLKPSARLLAKRGLRMIDVELPAVVETFSQGGYHIGVAFIATEWLAAH